MNVASLLRVSSRKQVRRQREDEIDIPGQRKAIDDFLATKPDWRLVRTYEEKGVSAYSKHADKRNELQTAHQDARSGMFKILVVFKYDRISRRKPLEYLNVLQMFADVGVKIWSVADNRFLEMDDHEFIMRVFEGYTANRYSKDLSERLKPRMRQIARDGRWTGGRVPFGFDLIQEKDASGNVILKGDRVSQMLMPNEDAHYVREIFRRYLDGQGTSKIARWMNEQAKSNPRLRDKVWSSESIRTLLRNPVYCGWVGYLYSRLGKTLGEDAILVKGKHEGIVTKDEWERTQVVMKERTHLPMRQRANTYALTGILRCGVCGSAVGGITRKKSSGEERQAYRCLGWKHKGTCTNSNMDALVVERSFVYEVTRLKEPDMVRRLFEQNDEDVERRYRDAVAQREAAQDRITVIDRALAKLRSKWLETDTLSDGEYNAARDEYLKERIECEKVMAAPLPEVKAVRMDELVELASVIVDGWYLVATQEQRKQFALSLSEGWGFTVCAYPDCSVKLVSKVPPA